MPQTSLHIIPILTARPFFTPGSLLKSINLVSFFLALGFGPIKVTFFFFPVCCYACPLALIPPYLPALSMALFPSPNPIKSLSAPSLSLFRCIFLGFGAYNLYVPVGLEAPFNVRQVPHEPPLIPTFLYNPNLSLFFVSAQAPAKNIFWLFFP